MCPKGVSDGSWQEEYWSGVSETARDFVRACLTVDPRNRPTSAQLLEHKWLKAGSYVTDKTSSTGSAVDLLPNVKAGFDAKKTCKSPPAGRIKLRWEVRKAVLGMMAAHRFQEVKGAAGEQTSAEKVKLAKDVETYKAEAERVSEDIG